LVGSAPPANVMLGRVAAGATIVNKPQHVSGGFTGEMASYLRSLVINLKNGFRFPKPSLSVLKIGLRAYAKSPDYW